MNDFNAIGMYEAMNAQRVERGLSWPQCAAAIWDQSSVLNELRSDHPISPSTLTGIAKRGNTSCQHALFILRWIGRTPETFLTIPPADHGENKHRYALPHAGADKRPRWKLAALYDAMNAERGAQLLTWKELATVLHCTEHQLKGIRTARFAIGMRLAMRITDWLARPARDFIYLARW